MKMSMPEEMILDNVIVTARRKSDSDAEKCDSGLEGIELVLSLKVGNDVGIFKNPGIDHEKLWKYAWKNTEEWSTVKPVGEAITSAGGPSIGQPDMFYVVTSKDMFCGAACLFTRKAAIQLALTGTDQFIMLPSSIHEVLLIPDHGDADLEGLAEIICSVNRIQVAENEQLGDIPYRINLFDLDRIF